MESWLREPAHLAMVLRPGRLQLSESNLALIGLIMDGGGGDPACQRYSSSLETLASRLVDLGYTDIGLATAIWPLERLRTKVQQICRRLADTGDFLLESNTLCLKPGLQPRPLLDQLVPLFMYHQLMTGNGQGALPENLRIAFFRLYSSM